MNEPETERNPLLMGNRPRTGRQALGKAAWIAIWFLYLIGPVGQLLDGGIPLAHEVLGWAGLVAFIGGYFALLFRQLLHLPQSGPAVLSAVVALGALAATLSLTLGPNWLVLFTFVNVAAAVVLPFAQARWAIPAGTTMVIAIGLRSPDIAAYLFAYALPCLAAGFTMLGVQHLIRTTKQLREAREEVARLAANDERLRLARDLHDLLGHSLSLITLKSELAGRMLPDRPEDAARQVADIERVSRQALIDVREAVTDYRRPQLAVELAGARAALRTAGVALTVDPALEREHRGLAADEEGALAWALREAVTNVVRHSGARRCELLLTEEWEADERHYLRLSVLDDGAGPPRAQHDGNGLSGLRERLALADGRLETGPAPRTHGFALHAYVPLLAPTSTNPTTSTDASTPSPPPTPCTPPPPKSQNVAIAGTNNSP
ncbi:putative two-component histidine kinase [Streptomyces sp. NBRC 110611]|uniref:sensor histidine kinase n=1 Tax=Streptomyces sp. NBRC 110611 TaxID=1621259 RepID=UPI0008572950|nr:sensor histidine kinase [Streptomyces sp. NBRC 110611]GAU65280.1 putative two-component histidine kinase [Streptomyces sp. NBRC 110611]